MKTWLYLSSVVAGTILQAQVATADSNSRDKKEPHCNRGRIGMISYDWSENILKICSSAGWGPLNVSGLTGPQGPAGPAGAPGLTGLQGVKGDKGDAGVQGLVGPNGEQGPMGPVGAPGLNGLKGDKGDAGIQGLAGPQGEQGPMGPVGAPGINGLKGDKGDAGIQGLAGPQGEQGPMGPVGASGINGLKGDKGDAGIQGLAGPQGEQGPTGPVGAPGINGLKGDKGDAGIQGLAGPQGEQGPIGPVGAPGLTGLKGDKGDKGDQGAVGLAGLQGIQGIEGQPGATGPQGLNGKVYEAGAGLKVEVDTISADTTTMKFSDTSLGCSSANAGTIRFRNAISSFEGCDGVSWRVLSFAVVAPTPKRVFVTSTAENVFAIQSPADADQICQSRAQGASLSGNWRAWYSDATSSPGTRFSRSTGAYNDLSGTLIASNFNDIIDGTLTNSISRNEYNQLVANNVRTITNTNTNGSFTGASCFANGIGTYGLVGQPSFFWTYGDINISCYSQPTARLFCFEQ